MNDNIQNKLIVINKFNLPSEIQDIIKAYIFYNCDEEKKKHKVLYLNAIDEINASSSLGRTSIFGTRFGALGSQFGITEDCTHWIFMNPRRTTIMQALFCVKCGCYVQSLSALYPSITCFCGIQQFQ